MLVAALGTFTAWYCWEEGQITNRVMARIAQRTFFLTLALHVIVIIDVLGRTARCVAEEKEKRTLEFLLATRLSSGEIILGKFAARMISFVGTLAAGFPVMLLLHRLGGIDTWLILLAYAGILSTGFLLAAMSIWISTLARDGRRAVGLAMLATCLWLWLPFAVAFILPRFGVHLPGWLLTVNAWALHSSPLGLLLRFPGLAASAALVDLLLRMCGTQLLAGAGCLLGAVFALRPACRAMAGECVADDRRILAGRKPRLRRVVGDDPILWKEMHTCRPRGLARLADRLVYLIIVGAIAYPTWFLGRLAVKEVWQNGYTSGADRRKRPEFNLIIRFLAPAVYDATDQARMEFNLLLRSLTVSLGFFLLLAALGFGIEAIMTERRRATWNSLLATPLDGRDILRAKLLGTCWRFRLGIGTLLLLWLLDLLTGSLHPLGLVLTLLVFACWIMFAAVWGMLAAVKTADGARDTNGTQTLIAMLSNASAALPYLLPATLNSVLWGSCSPLLVLWLTQFSYRDLRNLLAYPIYPHLHWIGIRTNEGSLQMGLMCLIGILLPLSGGVFVWRHLERDFDRLVGRACGKHVSHGLVVPGSAPVDVLSGTQDDT